MPLNTAQYVAPLNSQGVLTGLVQGVKQGPGVSILPDGTITLDASTAVGFVITNNPNAAQYVWPSAPGATAPGQMLADDGSGNLYWSSDFVQVFPTGGSFAQQGAAAIPAGPVGSRPSPAPEGYFRFNTNTGALEFSNGTSWLPVSPPTGGVFSFYQGGIPTPNAIGDLWYDTTVSTEKIWSGTSWVPVIPLASTTLPGRVQVGTNIQVSPAGVISVNQAVGSPGAEGTVGVTTLTDNVISTSINSALTANQGRILQNQIDALAVSNNLTLAGTISGAGLMTYVTPEGAAIGFTVGNPLPSSSAVNEGYFVIVDDPGGFTPPGGGFTTVTRGDWFESTGTGWQFLNVGYDPPIATTAQYGVTRLATNAETQAGTSSSIAVTPAGLFSVFSSGAIDANDILLLPSINGNTNVQAALADAVYDITSAGNTVTLAVTPTGKYNLEVTQATESQLGGAQIATNAETQALTLDNVIVTPLKLGNLFTSGAIDANDILLSPLINGNTTVQAALGDAVYDVTSSDNSVTVAETAVGQVDLTVAQATETQFGGGEIATQAETDAGISDTVLLTPKKLAGYIASGQIDASEVVVSPAINGNTDVQAVLSDAIYDISSSNNSVTVSETATGQVDVTVTQATETQFGGGEIATQAETDAGLSDTLIITPKKLAGYISSGQISASEVVVNPTINGNANVQAALADAVYDITSLGNTVVITSSPTGLFNVEVRQATETQLGGAEIATQTETETGTDDTRIVTPLKLRTAAVYKSDFNAKGDILSAQGNDQPLILPVGTNAQFLVVDNTTPTGLKWYTLPSTIGVLGGVSNLGLTTITDNTTSTSIDSALSARMGKLMQDQINALVITNNLTFAGTLNSAGNLTYVTTEGAAAGFTVGSPLPVSSAGNKEYFVICEQAGTITPPGGVATTVTQGDWFVSTGTGWQFLNVGFDVPLASTTQAGIVRLATNAETQTGTDATIAVTPAGLTSRTATETRTGIAELATQVETEAGTDDTRIVTPLKLRTATVYKSDFNAKGDLLSASANDTPAILGVGTNGQILTVDSTTATGLKWSTAGVPAFYNLDDISGSFNGINKIFNLAIGGVSYTPTPASNIMVFLGGVSQIPGVGKAYTVSGSTITFDTAPPAGTTFYATTVK